MRCGGVAVPGDANVYFDPPALMSATSSLTLPAGTDGWTARTIGDLTATVTGTKSFCSYGTFSYMTGLTTIFGGTTTTV